VAIPKRLHGIVGACAIAGGLGLNGLSPAALASMNEYEFMQACMNEGASYPWCRCAADHILDGANAYQAATLCNKGIGAMSGGSSGGGYRGNNVACTMMRDYPLMLAAMNCY